MKIPTQIWIFCVGIFLQHYTFLQKRTFCILCEKFFHFVRKATIIAAQVMFLVLLQKTVIRMLTTTLAINFIMALVLLKIMKKHLTIT